MQEEPSLPYPLNLPEREKFDALRAMPGAERMQIANKLTNEGKRRWLQSLREEFPGATEAEFRSIVIERLLQASEEERRIASRLKRRGHADPEAGE